MQIAHWIQEEGWSDQPSCVHPAIRALAIRANDELGDQERQKMLDLLPRMMNTNSEDKLLSVRLAIFCARKTLHIFEERYPDDLRPRAAIEAAERWREAPSEAAKEEAANAADAAYAATDAAYAAANAAYAAANAAYAAAAANAATAADAATAAVNAADVAYDLLLAVLDEYDRLTDRSEVESVDLDPVTKMLAEALA